MTGRTGEDLVIFCQAVPCQVEIDHDRKGAAERGIPDLEEIVRVHGRCGIPVHDMHAVHRYKPDAEQERPGWRIGREEYLINLPLAGDEYVSRGADCQAVCLDAGWTGKVRYRWRRRGKVEFSQHTAG